MQTRYLRTKNHFGCSIRVSFAWPTWDITRRKLRSIHHHQPSRVDNRSLPPCAIHVDRVDLPSIPAEATGLVSSCPYLLWRRCRERRGSGGIYTSTSAPADCSIIPPWSCSQTAIRRLSSKHQRLSQLRAHLKHPVASNWRAEVPPPAPTLQLKDAGRAARLLRLRWPSVWGLREWNLSLGELCLGADYSLAFPWSALWSSSSSCTAAMSRSSGERTSMTLTSPSTLAWTSLDPSQKATSRRLVKR